MVIQFRVPDSNPNCNTNNPPVADQFPITGVHWAIGGIGNDWSVLTSGTNNLGQTAYERYGEFRPIASSPAGVGNAVAVWGYGVDSQCTRSQTQQTDNGSVTQVFGTYFRHNVDITFGNSGSAVIRNGEILGIVTNCPCPSYATRVDNANFVAARDQLCPVGCPWDLDGNNDVGVGDLLILLGAWGPNPGHPADFDGNNNVGVSDLLVLLANWGPCP